MVNEKRLEGISDIRDESDRDGMRIVIELKRDAYARVVLNNLYKQTPIQANFGANMLALVNQEPQLLTIKQFLAVFLEFRIETIIRRTQYELRKAEERDHLLLGLLIALGRLDGIIRLIRESADTATAKQELVAQYGLSEVQADAILQMQLRRLTALEAQKIEAEHTELELKITELRSILADRERILEIVETEAVAIKTTHSTPRLTTIDPGEGEIFDIDLIANEKSLILVTEQGYIKRMPVSTFEAQNRATRGKAATKMKDDDGIKHFFTCCDHDSILFFTDQGVVYSIRAYQIPTASRTAKGAPIIQLLPIPREEQVTSIVPVSEFSDEEYLVMLTVQGFVKKTALSAFSHIRANGLIAISLEEADQARAEDSLIVGSRKGMAIHFRTDHTQLRPMGRTARGVRAMKLTKGDNLISMDVLPSSVVATIASDVSEEGNELETELTELEEAITPELEEVTSLEDGGNEEAELTVEGPWILVITSNGYGKRVPVGMFRLQRRFGKGIIATKFKSKTSGDQLVALRVVNPGDELMIVTNRGIIIRQSVDAISTQSRSATGVRVQRLDEDDAIAAVALVPPTIEGEEETLEEG
jgi:DNA gyrase subunit A